MAGTVSVGDKVWFDTNANGYFDSGEGVAGVSLTLFLDVDHSGTLTGSDTQVATTLTLAGGGYSFTGLAEGDYVVRVDASNFQAGGALLGDVSVAGANDPDDNADNDDNGVQYSGYVASKAITLTDGAEPGADPSNNITVDFGFVANQAPDATDDSVPIAEDSRCERPDFDVAMERQRPGWRHPHDHLGNIGHARHRVGCSRRSHVHA